MPAATAPPNVVPWRLGQRGGYTAKQAKYDAVVEKGARYVPAQTHSAIMDECDERLAAEAERAAASAPKRAPKRGAATAAPAPAKAARGGGRRS